MEPWEVTPTAFTMRLAFDDERAFIWRVMGIDNGSEKLGVAIADHDIRTNVSTVIYGRTFLASKVAYTRYPGLAERRGAMTARLRAGGDFLREILEEFDPDIAGIESPFKHLNVETFGKLTLSMESYIDEIFRWRHSMEVVKVPPGKAKKEACEGFVYKDDKEHIRQCLLRTKAIVPGPGIILEEFEEDTMDGLSVARYVAMNHA